MKVLVTGATGFVGRHVVAELLSRQYKVIAVARNADSAKKMPWYSKVTFIACNIHDADIKSWQTLVTADAVIHLAWPGLPNYTELFHFEENLPAAYRFLKKLVISGLRHVLVAGTCAEYGMQSGPLSEEANTMPVTPYGLAKDTLRKFLQELQKKHDFSLQWARLFYIYGPGQYSDSVLSQLDKAIDSKEATFNMSEGKQLRDYLPVEDVARYLVSIIEHRELSGIINCCSGEPISIRNLVEKRITERKADIKLNLGYYPYPDYEPMEFWGDRRKLDSILEGR